MRIAETVQRTLVITAALAAALGLVGAIIALAVGRNISATIAGALYIVGCLLFLVGMFPSGGFSLRRGTMTQRQPMGSRREPVLFVGVLLVGVGVLVDVARPL